MMWRSNAKLREDVARWRAAGWVTAPGEAAILAEIKGRRGPAAGTVLGLLGAALLCFAGLSFVAAHWEGLPRLVRLLVLVAAMGGAYAAAAELFARGLPAFGHAGLVVGAGLFGANIMLTAQMYHIDGNPPDAVLVWAIGALATGLLGRSKPVLGMALGLMCLWGGWETAQRLTLFAGKEYSPMFWPFLVGWAAVTAAIGLERWRYGLHLAAVALGVFVVSLGYLWHGPRHELVFLIGLAVAGAGVWASVAADKLPAVLREADAVMAYGLGVAAAGLYAAQFSSHYVAFGVWAAIGLALAVGAIAFGIQAGRTGVARIGYLGFTVETLTIYFKTVGTLLGSAGFFLVAGGLLVGLAVVALKLERSVAARKGS